MSCARAHAPHAAHLNPQTRTTSGRTRPGSPHTHRGGDARHGCRRTTGSLSLPCRVGHRPAARGRGWPRGSAGWPPRCASSQCSRGVIVCTSRSRTPASCIAASTVGCQGLGAKARALAQAGGRMRARVSQGRRGGTVHAQRGGAIGQPCVHVLGQKKVVDAAAGSGCAWQRVWGRVHTESQAAGALNCIRK